jgi:hypothetical protein
MSRAGFVKQKRRKKVPSFVKQKVASSSTFIFINETDTDFGVLWPAGGNAAIRTI